MTHKCLQFNAPISGTIHSLEKSLDETVRQGLLGKGVLIEPLDETVYSPCSGQIVLVYPTKHAIIIKSKEAVVVLIHIGMDTAKLEGEGFQVFVADGELVTCGQPLIKFDRQVMKEHNLSLLTPIVFPCLKEREEIKIMNSSYAHSKEPLIEIKILK